MDHVHEETVAKAEVPVGAYFAAHKDAVTLALNDAINRAVREKPSDSAALLALIALPTRR